jgi:tetratricopeptide (TPR) repeat protein/ferredoxin
VLILVHALVAVHVVHWAARGTTLSPLEPSEAMEYVKHGLVNAGLVFFGLTLLSTLILGRWFCGWACHLVALQDLSLALLKKVGLRPRPLRSRLLAWVPLAAAVYMFLWPLTYRLWTGLGWPRAHVALTREDFWGTFPPWPVALATFVVCGGVVIWFLGAKGFCTYACPYGALYGALDRLSPGRIRVTDACEGCAHCTAVCTSNVLVHQEVREHGMVVDPGCMKCLDCVSVCPKGALYFGLGVPALGRSARAAGKHRGGLTWREEGLLALAFALVFLAWRGVYGVVPFLLALALAAIGAFLALQTLRLARRPGVSLGQIVLKRDGHPTVAGRWFVVLVIAVALSTGHSGMVQWQTARAREAFGDVEESYARALGVPAARADDPALERARKGADAARFLQRWGWLATPGNLAWQARFALVLGREDDFEQLARRALSEAPSAVGHLDLARFLEARGRPQEALDQYRDSLRLAPSPDLYDRVAQRLWGMGDGPGAVALFAEGVARHPENADLLYNLGVAQATLGRYEEAAATFRRVLELDPDRPGGHEILADLEAVLGAPPTPGPAR